ncbi:MAG: Eco57I restriction-modification methylase domain-containing protein [Cyanobacteriota bacterium]
MPALASDFRKTLENTVVKARELAERGARDVLTALAVGASEPFASMSEEERRLRNRLRAHGRQLGDQRDPRKGTQSIERLVREMAYEHWHRMLFARFLAENQLLIEPSSGVSISLGECEELATEEGTDLWGLAASYAQVMLPEIFRTDDPVLALKLPLEIRQRLQALVAGLEGEVFTASDSLGWTYQFWQTKRKKEVKASEVDIGADELPVVTQLFTEDYMVDFLLDNTLGAWHAGKALNANPELASTAQTEDDLRQAVTLPGCPWRYLRFVKADDGAWTPAAGTFEAWPKTTAELKCLDPCMGSGHFVVAMFERLVALRLAEGEQMEPVAVAAVIESNLFGLEIDPRCTQIAAFNLALAAWRRLGHCKLPAMNLACSGLAPNTREADWLAMAGDNERLRNGMERLYRLFQKASVLGSLVNPRAAGGDVLVAAFQELKPLLEQLLTREIQDDSAYEMSVTARGLTKAAEILAGQFTLVATNVPYLARGEQHLAISEYCESAHPNAKTDLATCFVERCLSLGAALCTSALVTPQNWLAQDRYVNFRKDLLEKKTWKLAAQLGPGAFRGISGEVVKPLLFISDKTPAPQRHNFICIDTTPSQGADAKDCALREQTFLPVSQSDQTSNPKSRISFGYDGSGKRIADFALYANGVQTGDLPRFSLYTWELDRIAKGWACQQTTLDSTTSYGGMLKALFWQDGDGVLASFVREKLASDNTGAWLRGKDAWGKRGVLVSAMGSLQVALYLGDLFDDNTVAIIPRDEKNLPAIWALCSDSTYHDEVRKIDKALKVRGPLVEVPFDLDHWQKVAADKYPHGLPKPLSSDPTQWLFNGHPAGADHPLHVAVARLVGYLWPRQTGSSFPECPALGADGLERLADDDGIVCLSPVRGEASAADRLRGFLATAFGDEWSKAKERELLLETAVANGGTKAAANLADWLHQNFFAEHCKLFNSRPFIWHVWDGNPNGFSALVNYHKLVAPNGQGRKTLELLTYTYLGRDWIDRQKQDQADGVNGADDRLAAALDLRGQLEKILEGEPPYDVFVRWKPLQQQAIGWDPDINDGVRLNIRPFITARLRKGGVAGAGIFRAKPGTIKWPKDKGKEPMRSKEEFPWFWGWVENSQAIATDFGAPVPGAPPSGDSFDGNRWNDLHYTRAAKEAARARHRGEG